jgi:WD40 repeat protein
MNGGSDSTKMRNAVPAVSRAAFIFCLAFCTALPVTVRGQSSSFAGNAQHTANYPVAPQRLSATHWSANVDDLSSNAGSTHYGEPLVTASNTVIVPYRTNRSGFQIHGYDGVTGRLKYTLTNDFAPIPYTGWAATYQPVLALPAGNLTLCYPGPGGTVYYVQNPDSDTPSAPVQVCFYTNLSAYASNAAAYNSSIYIDTPLTSDTNGNLFFGFRVQGTAPAPISSTNSGFARIDSSGNGTYVLAGIAAGDSLVYRDCHNLAPALSGDGSTLYVAAKGSFDSYGYLLGLDATNLSTKFRTRLLDPRNTNGAILNDDATSSPMVGPDGDVFMAVRGIPDNYFRGFLLHFSADLQTRKPPGAFGWDYTAGIVPTNMLPGYSGSSPYLIFSKYNNYAGGDGNGINKLALLDPGATQLDPHTSATGLVEMRELLTVSGCTPDGPNVGSVYPFAVSEWCVNTSAVNPATHSIISLSEDGQIYRWDLASNSLAEVYNLGSGIGEPYVPTCIGPDGTVFTINGAKLFALGGFSKVDIAIYSSTPDLRSVVTNQSLTFTAVVTNLSGSGPVPTGIVTFQDKFYKYPITRIITTLANVPLVNGTASVSTSALYADGTNNGCHFITARYSGDANFPAGTATMVQKIHAHATLTTLTPSTSNNAVIFTATVASSPPGGGTPTGFAAFSDGSKFLAQLPLTNGSASYVTTNLGAAPHAITAAYTSDTLFASSTGGVIASPIQIASAAIGANGLFQLSFSNSIGASFTALGAPDPTVPLTNWSNLGPVTELLPGVFQFQDPQSTNSPWQFYRVRSP